MKGISFSLLFSGLILLIVSSCQVKSDPLVYGKDACYSCKMTLVDRRFGSEVVTRKGKVYKFDDVNCMVGFLKSGFEPDENIELILAADFEVEGTLIDARRAYFLHSEQLNTPMGSGVGVFVSTEQAQQRNADFPGEVEDWDATKGKF